MQASFREPAVPDFHFHSCHPRIANYTWIMLANHSRPLARGRNMKLLDCVQRFLASEDGTSDFENVVLVACIVMLCLSIQIHAHRNPQMTGAPAVRSAYHSS